jgi:CHAT domain-containing protein/tetratricopeptide (TPR) repeat protein
MAAADNTDSLLAQDVTRLEALATEGRADDALALARRLLADADALSTADLATTRAVNRLGVFLSNRNFDAEARRAFDRAASLLSASDQHDDALLGDIDNNLGQLDERAGDLESAERRLEAALKLHRSASHPLTAAFTADNLGVVLARRGRLDRAEALHREALAVLNQAGPRHLADLATVLGNLGVVYRRRGDLARAKAHLLRAIDTHLRVASLEHGHAWIPLVNLVDLAIEQDDQRLAGELADALLRAGGERRGAALHPLAVGLLQLGTASFEHFQLGLAERLATRALTLFESSVGAAAPQTLRAVQLLANAHAAKGNFDAAEQGLLRVLNTPGIDPKLCAELLIDLGKAVRQRGPQSHAAAVGLFESAIRLLRERHDADPRLLASALGNLGLVHFANDELDAADARYAEAIALGAGRRPDSGQAWLLHNRGLLHYHVGRHDEARGAIERARAIWRRLLGANHPFVATCEANLALVHWSRGDRAAALRAFARAQRLRAAPLLRTLLVGTERERLEAARENQDDLFKLVSFCLAGGKDEAAARLAATLLLQRKAIVLDALAMTQARLRERLDAAARVRFDRLLELRGSMAASVLATPFFGDAADRRSLATMQAEEQALQVELSHAGAFGAGALEPVGLDAVRAALPPDAALVEYLRWSVFDPKRTGHGVPWRGERYAALVLRKRGAPRWFDLGDAAGIDARARDLRALLREPASDVAAIGAASFAVHRRLVAPFEPLLARAPLVLIAPDGELNLLPFAVLGDPMLGDAHVVCHLASGRELLRSAGEAVAGAPVQVIVDPDFDAPAPGSAMALEPLPGTRAEASVIESLFGGSRVVAGADASVEALKAIERPALLHIATHALFMPVEEKAPLLHEDLLQVGGAFLLMQRASPSAAANPMLHAGLALAGANRSGPGRLVGFLSAAELAALDLRATELVVLSACDTGLGSAAHGAEFAGLRRAIAIAGAASQVISLWEIDDEAAPVFMRAFYRSLLAGAGRAEALQQAQRELRRHPQWTHPSAWGAFAAWGAATPLSETLRASARKAATP